MEKRMTKIKDYIFEQRPILKEILENYGSQSLLEYGKKQFFGKPSVNNKRALELSLGHCQ